MSKYHKRCNKSDEKGPHERELLPLFMGITITIAVCVFALLISLFFFPVIVFTWTVLSFSEYRQSAVHSITATWIQLIVVVNPLWTIRIINQNKLTKEKNTVFISNHLSILDIMWLFHLNKNFRWISKKENLKIPIVGLVMRMAGYLAIDRENREKHDVFYQQCASLLKTNISVFFFPEGTRSRNGSIGVFKEGAFRVALQNRSGIQAIYIYKAENSSKSILKMKQTIHVLIMDYLPYEDFPYYSSIELAEWFHHYYLTKILHNKI